jgi:hypothetical protein
MLVDERFSESVYTYDDFARIALQLSAREQANCASGRNICVAITSVQKTGCTQSLIGSEQPSEIRADREASGV